MGGVASGLDGARQAVVSPDGQHLYVASQESDAVVVFQRNPATGSLKFLGVHRDESVSVCVQPTTCTIHSLDGAGALAVDPAGDESLRGGAETTARSPSSSAPARRLRSPSPADSRAATRRRR